MGLILHCGTSLRSRQEVVDSPTPNPTSSWHPVPHFLMVDLLEEKMPQHGFQIIETALSMNIERTRMFGMMKIQSDNSEYAPVLGFRNAHDKMFSQGLVCGSEVFVCDNLAFSSEIIFNRRHTPNILRDLPGIVDEALSKLNSAQTFQNDRILNYKAMNVNDVNAHHFLVEAMKKNIFSPSKIEKIVEEWDHPRHDEFAPRNLWSLFNAVTEILKGGNIWVRSTVTQSLFKLCDEFVVEDYNAHRPTITVSQSLPLPEVLETVSTMDQAISSAVEQMGIPNMVSVSAIDEAVSSAVEEINPFDDDDLDNLFDNEIDSYM